MKYTLFLIGLFLLSSCSFSSLESTHGNAEQGKTAFSDIQNKYQEKHAETRQVAKKHVAVPLAKTVEAIFQVEGNHVTISLQNPQKTFIQAARLWLAFPANTLQIKHLNLNTQVFDLAAPGEYLVDKENGIIKIGLSSTIGTTDENILVGSFDINNMTKNSVPVTCYDYSEDTDSHCTVLGKERKNMLKAPQGFLVP